MIYKIESKAIATESYFNEIYFIMSKWKDIEVQKFEDLVYVFLAILSKSPEIGIYKSDYKCYALVISKQTTLFSKIIKSKCQIDLILFWNNKQNSIHLKKLLH